VLDYIPGKLNLELKALKLYLWSFRDRGVFHEAVTNEIVDQMVARLKPRFLRLTAKWYVRGGLFTTVVVEHRKQGWKPSPGTPLGAGQAPSDGPSVRG
jgi:7-cyano-7-deazaguanine reductase